MIPPVKMVFSYLAIALAFGWTSAAPAAPDYIERDVCVIGGGAGGTYAAIRLQQEGKSVALIEKQNRLGGHVDTYIDPATGNSYDYGVQAFSNISVLTNFFEHFNVPLVPLPASSDSGPIENVNFETGESVEDSELIEGNLPAALMRYSEQQAKYSQIFQEWDLPDPVPEDLLMPWGDFIKKYRLKGMAQTAYMYNQGMGNILAQPTLYVMKYLDPVQVQSFLGQGFVVNALQNNQLLYDRAAKELGSDALLSSNVNSIVRHENCVDICVSTPDGLQLIRASKLVIAIPPKLCKLNFLDLDQHERGIFGQFNNSYYWDAVLKNTGIPAGTSVTNMNADAPYNIPATPNIYTYRATPIDGVVASYYNSADPVSNAEVKEDILTTLAELRKSLGYPEPKEPTEFVGFNNHSPFVLTASNDAIRNGFYKDLLALQGRKNTYYTGATWMNPATATIWRYTEEKVLPQILG